MTARRLDEGSQDPRSIVPLQPFQLPTSHELVVLELVALGLSNRQIAIRLWTSRQTVTYHIGNLLSKFMVQTRAGLVARAYVIGVLLPGEWPPRLAPMYAAMCQPLRSADPDAGRGAPVRGQPRTRPDRVQPLDGSSPDR